VQDLQIFWVSLVAVTLAEIGDKTQLVAFMLATRFRQPLPIIAGLAVATTLNHVLAGTVGTLLGGWLNPVWLRWITGVGFLTMAAWALIPDRDASEPSWLARYGAFGTTLITFFLAEMGDKTQLATMALAAKFHAFVPVVAGTAMGMLVADVPAVFLGARLQRQLPLHWIRGTAALVFAVLGVLTLLGYGNSMLK